MRVGIYSLDSGEIQQVMSGPIDTVLANAGEGMGAIQMDAGSNVTRYVDVTSSPHRLVERPEPDPDSRPAATSDAKAIRNEYELRPIEAAGALWDCDERSLFRLDAIAKVAQRDQSSIPLVDARNGRRTMSAQAQARLPDEIREALGDRFARLNAEYNAIKSEIEGGAVLTVAQVRLRLEAQL